MQKVSAQTFEAEVNQSELPVLVDFYADWCGPCKRMEPFLAKASEDFNGKAKIVKMNTEDNSDFVGQFEVRGLPTLILFKGGKEVDRRLGLQSLQDIHKLLNSHL